MSERDHDHAREIAQDISEGINCLVSVLQVDKSADRPPDGCLEALDAMVRAYESIRDGVVVTDDVPSVDDIVRVRRVRELVSDWLTTGRASPVLVPMMEEILNRMGINLDALDLSNSE